jgi:hypothetical protein
MNCLIVLIMMFHLLVKLWLLVLVLVCMMLIPPILSHILWSLFFLLLLQILMNNIRAFLMTRLFCLQENFGRCTSFGRRGEETPKTLRAASSPTTPTTSSSTAPRVRSMTTLTIRRIIALGTTRRRTSRRSCPEHVYLKNRRRRSEGGWMRVNQNSSMEHDLYPKFDPTRLSSSSAKTK